jgi:hypothetical protein
VLIPTTTTTTMMLDQIDKKKQSLGLATKHDSASRLAKQNFKHT